LIQDLISIHNAENWLGGDGDEFAPSFFSSGGTDDSSLATTPTGIDFKIENPKETTASPVSSESVLVASVEENKLETKTILKEDTKSEDVAPNTANTVTSNAVSSSSGDDSSKEKTAGDVADSSTKTDEGIRNF